MPNNADADAVQQAQRAIPQYKYENAVGYLEKVLAAQPEQP
jgi:hypothetical protein